MILAVFWIFSTLIWGCGGDTGSTEKFPSARLEGSVTLDGKPVDDGTIQFVPANKTAGPVTQALILKGRYVASKVPLGKVSAMISTKPPEPPANVTSDYHPEPFAQIPKRYQDGITIEVKENKLDVDFDMSSRN